MTPARSLLAGLSVVALSGVSYCSYNFATAQSRVRDLCAELKPGMSIDDVRVFARRNGLGPPPGDSGTSYIVEKKTFGRWGCRIESQGGIVKIAEFNFAS